MSDERLITFNSLLQVRYLDVFMIAMSQKDAPWAIQIPLMVAFEIGDVSPIVHHNCFEAYMDISNLETIAWR